MFSNIRNKVKSIRTSWGLSGSPVIKTYTSTGVGVVSISGWLNCGSAGKESLYNVENLGLIPGLGRSPGERERLPTPVFWPGEFHGLYNPWGHKESDMT